MDINIWQGKVAVYHALQRSNCTNSISPCEKIACPPAAASNLSRVASLQFLTNREVNLSSGEFIYRRTMWELPYGRLFE
jgi:hypothetical protein